MVEEKTIIIEEIDKLKNNKPLICSSIDFISGDIPSLIFYFKNSSIGLKSTIVFCDFIEFEKKNFILSLEHDLKIKKFNCRINNQGYYLVELILYKNNQDLTINIICEKIIYSSK